jgi:hypothetical protein
MKAIDFKEANTEFAKDQPQYKTLPALKTNDGEVVTRYKLSFKERVKVLFTGEIWHGQLTFNKPMQPQLLSVNKKDLIIEQGNNSEGIEKGLQNGG